MKRLLILGGTGFIGKNMYESFRSKYDIDFPTRNELDVLKEVDVYNYLKKSNYDVIINAIDLREASQDYFEKRLRIFLNLQRHSDLYGKMIYFGSGAEYARELPIVKITEEEFDRKIPEDSYGFCLHQMSQYARSSSNIYNLRLFGIYGKYEIWQKRFISNAICKVIYGYPITIRQNAVFDYLYIDDLCKIVEWVINETPQYHDYNAVSGTRYELKELANIVNNVMNKHVPIFVAKDGMGKEYSASNNRLRSEMVTFQPMDIGETITNLSEWYLQNINEIDRWKLLYQ